jgi:hypothetical protein
MLEDPGKDGKIKNPFSFKGTSLDLTLIHIQE